MFKDANCDTLSDCGVIVRSDSSVFVPNMRIAF